MFVILSLQKKLCPCYDIYDTQRITFQNSVATKRVTSANQKR